MNSKKIVCVAGLIALLASGSALAEPRLEAGLLGHYLFTNRDGVDYGYGVGLDGLLLRNAYDGLSFRVSASVLRTDVNYPGTNTRVKNDFNREAVNIGYWRYLDGDGFTMSQFRPFVNADIGLARQVNVRNDLGGDDGGVSVEAAFGLVSKRDVLIPNLKFRTEIRVGYEDSFGGATDVGIGAGLHYVFGERAPAPAPVAAKPAPAPMIAPPPPAPVAKAAPVRDSDGDGVADGQDKCSGTAKGAVVDANGCVAIEKLSLKGVSFTSGTAKLLPGASAPLNSVAAAMKANPKLKMEIGGYTDSVGDSAKNLKLSQRRADAVKAYLVKAGVGADRLTATGFGASKPVDSNDTPAGRSNNRRVEFNVTDQ